MRDNDNDNDNDSVLCAQCQGSGEGQHEGSCCHICHGSGEVGSDQSRADAEAERADYLNDQRREAELDRDHETPETPFST